MSDASPQLDHEPVANRVSLPDGDFRRLMQSIEHQLARIADHFDPAPPSLVGTGYIAAKLGCTTDWITMMVREGQIPTACLVAGTGNHKPWKFYRQRIDEWIEQR
jgi:hypothetical protein